MREASIQPLKPSAASYWPAGSPKLRGTATALYLALAGLLPEPISKKTGLRTARRNTTSGTAAGTQTDTSENESIARRHDTLSKTISTRSRVSGTDEELTSSLAYI